MPGRAAAPAAYGTITRSGGPFQVASARNSRSRVIEDSPVLQPRRDESRRFRLVPVRSPLLRQSRLLSFPGGTEMFQFPRFATQSYGFTLGQFRDPGIKSRLTNPPGLSQSSTPFIAFWRLDIPHTPLVAWPH